MKCFKVFSLCLAMLFIASCQKRTPPPPPPPVKIIKQVRTTRHFSEIQFDGDLNVVINQRRKGSSLTLKGDSRDLAFITTKVKDGRVIVDIPEHYLRHGPVTATVSVNKLNYLGFNGNGDINGKNLRGSAMKLHLFINGEVNLSGRLNLSELKITGKNKTKIKGVSSKALDIVMNGDSDITMQGMVNLEKLKFAGTGKLALHWIDSPDLEIAGFGSVKVNLAGAVRYLNVTTHDTSQVDARYLRSKKVYVKARDKSLIRVVPIKELNAYASEQGHIYYYQSPIFKADHMSQNGAVLNFVRYR